MKPNSSKGRKRKKPKVPVTQDAGSGIRNKQKTRCDNRLVSKLHELVKEQEQIKGDVRIQDRDKLAKVTAVQTQIDQLGGLQAYQVSSQLGKSRHGNVSTSKWILNQMKEHKIQADKASKLKLLDVGALEVNYTRQTNWIDCVAIDLNPHSPGIIKADFLEFQEDKPEMYDIIVMSLVLNFAGSPDVRGDMLKKCGRICKPNGHLFVVLPLACLENSRYLIHATFHNMLNSLGFKLITSHNSPKLSYKMFIHSGRHDPNLKKEEKGKKKMEKKKKVFDGVKCNNFKIVIR